MTIMTEKGGTEATEGRFAGWRSSSEITMEDLAELRERDDTSRFELIGGVLIVTPAPGFGHNTVVMRLANLLDQHCPDELRVGIAPFEVVLDKEHAVQPDLVVLDPKEGFTDARFFGAPLLAVEVLSPSSVKIDTLLKRDLYARVGVRSYWLLDPNYENPAIRVLELDGDDYTEVAYAIGNDAVNVASPFPVRIVPAELMRRATPSRRHDERHDRGEDRTR